MIIGAFFPTLVMMIYDTQFFAVALPAAFIAGFAKGGFGGGAAFVATALLALIVPPATALGIMLPLLMVVDLFTLKPFWRQWDWPSAKALMIGAVPGVALGAALYQLTNADVLRVLIGLISVLFVIYQVARGLGYLKVSDRAFDARTGWFAGVVSGFTSFVSHAGGPPAAMYLLSQGMGKTTYQATAVLAFWGINIFKAVPYAFLGVFTVDTFEANLYMIPFALVGAAAGVYAHRVMPERLFFRITYVLLLGTGSKLILDGLT